MVPDSPPVSHSAGRMWREDRGTVPGPGRRCNPGKLCAGAASWFWSTEDIPRTEVQQEVQEWPTWDIEHFCKLFLHSLQLQVSLKHCRSHDAEKHQHHAVVQLPGMKPPHSGVSATWIGPPTLLRQLLVSLALDTQGQAAGCNLAHHRVASSAHSHVLPSTLQVPV